MQTTEQHIREQIVATGFNLSEQETAFAVGFLMKSNVAVGRIAAIIDGVREGISLLEFCGATPETLEGLEQRAIDLYRNKQYDEAYAFFFGAKAAGDLLGTPRLAAMRGMAACNHSQSFLLDAIDQYQEVLALDPSDLISCVSLACCLCLVGQSAKGLAVAHQALTSKRTDQDAKKLMAQAKALIDTRGGAPVRDGARRRNTALGTSSKGPGAARLAEEILRNPTG